MLPNLIGFAAFLVLGILFMVFNRPLGRFFAHAQGRVWDRFTKHWEFSFSDPSSIGAAQFSVFVIGLAAAVVGSAGLVLSLATSN